MTAGERHLPPGTAASSVDLLAAGSLPRSWLARWAADPSAPTVFDDASGWVTADQLEHRTRTAAGRLAAAGLHLGDRLVISAQTSVELVVAHVAALRLGAVVVPANAAYRAGELAHIVRDARPTMAIVDDDERGTWIRAAADGDITITSPDLPLPDGADPAWLDGVGLDDPAILAYTSGTTGAPKGALLSHANLLASAEALRLAWRWTPEDRLVLPLPLFHMHGLGVGLHGTLTAGASVVLRPSFDPADVAAAVRHHRGTLFFGVPTMWRRLLSSAQLTDLAGLRLGVSGSAPLAQADHEAIYDASGLRLIERYGMTETVMNVSNPYDGERRAGTVGFALPGVEVRLAEETDEILLRGPNVFHGYWQRPDATAESFDDDWFRSGDVGAFDADGYLQIVGRRKELIISGGYNVYPREVEDVLREHRSVADVAVVGVADPEWGEQVVAVIEGGDASDADVAALRDLARDRLANYKRPKRFVFVEALPRNALGKVLKDQAQRLVT